MKKILLILFVGLFLISLTSATLGTFKQGVCVDIKTILNTTQVNISSISYPNLTTAISSKETTKIGQTFNYTFCETDVLGTYIYDYYDTEGNVYVNDFIITQNGMTTTTAGSITYIALLGLLIFFFVLNAIAISKLPHSNPRSDSGKILSISLLKYLKPTLIVLGYGIIIAILIISSNIAEAYLGHSIANLLFQLFKLSTRFIYLVVLLWIIYIAINVFRDIKLNHFFQRGYEP